MTAREDLNVAQAEFAECLQDKWCEITGFAWHPETDAIRAALQRNTPEEVDHALVTTARRIASRQVSSYGDNWLKYFRGVLRKMREERGEE
jgi:hypothetical protein